MVSSVVKKLLPGAAGTAGAGGDDDFNLVTTLLPANGSNGAQNSTFLDSSDNNLTITAGSDVPAQGTFSPFSADEGKWSAQFTRATPDYIQVASSSDFAFGTGDFTIECWCYLTSGQNAYGNGLFAPTTGVVGPALGQHSDDGWQIYHGTSSTDLADTSYPQDEWVHVAMVRASNVLNVYQNGVKVTSDISDSTNYTNTGFNIGWYYGTAYAWDGFISNFRVVKGTAVYTGAFTPPTEPLTAITNTKLLTCCSNRFRDKSTSAHSLTTSSYPKIKPFSPFKNTAEYDPAVHGGSFLFEKNANSYLEADHATLFDFGTADYCIEAWLYPTQTSFSNSWAMWFNTKGVNQYWAYTNGGGNQAAAGFSAYPAGGYSASNAHILTPYTWNHCVFQNTGGYENWYLNGTRIYNVQNNPSLSASATGVRVGNSPHYASYFYYGGYISDLRVTTGANYNPYSNATTLTVPTAPLTKGNYTRLLLNGTNAAITDSSGMSNLETVGNAQLDTSVKKFGSASAEFDGTGDYLTYPLITFFEFGSSDWTIECFVNVDAVSATYKCIYSASYGVQFYVYNNLLHLAVNDTDNTTGYMISANSGTGISASTWHHVAAYRLGSAFYCSIDGVVTSMGTSSATIASPVAAAPSIGIWGGASLPMDGYIDDLRITRKARYGSSNFTAPTKAFPSI